MVHKSLILLSVALLLTNTVFILNSLLKPERNLNLCIFSAILFHYLILATFMSMLVLSVAQYLAFVKIFTYCVKYFTLKSILFAFGKYSFLLTLRSLFFEWFWVKQLPKKDWGKGFFPILSHAFCTELLSMVICWVRYRFRSFWRVEFSGAKIMSPNHQLPGLKCHPRYQKL